MTAQLLKKYMDHNGLTQTSLSNKIGSMRQTVWHWVKDGATVELTDIGIRIRLKSGRIVHETQVAKS